MSRLRAGDRRIRAVVRPSFPEAPRSTWPCTGCGQSFDAASSHAVLYGDPDEVPYAFMVCPTCARGLDGDGDGHPSVEQPTAQ